MKALALIKDPDRPTIETLCGLQRAGCEMHASCPPKKEALHALEAAGVKSTSRPLRMRVNQLRWENTDNALWLEFRLGKGSFATSVLREFVRYTQHQP